MFCHIFEKYQGYFFAKKGGGGVFAKFENYLGTFLRWRGWVVVNRPPSLKFLKIQGFQGGFLGFQALFKVFR